MGQLLLVDDDTVGREALGRLLERQGYQILQAANGRQALELLTRQTHAPRFILLDLEMPVMNGWEFLRELNHLPLSFRPRVIVISGRCPLPMVGVMAMLQKPIAIPELLDLIQNCEV
jgi:CheY-like chemotaxis protein